MTFSQEYKQISYEIVLYLIHFTQIKREISNQQIFQQLLRKSQF